MPQKIARVQPQFLQAGARHVGQLEFGFFGGAAGLTALSNVLRARTRRLHHLVVRTASLLDVAVAETHGHIIDQLRHLKTLQLPVTAMRGNELLSIHRANAALTIRSTITFCLSARSLTWFTWCKSKSGAFASSVLIVRAFSPKTSVVATLVFGFDFRATGCKCLTGRPGIVGREMHDHTI